MPTFRLLIKGKVQGVYYRDTARKTALRLGVTGWVKNREDGNVEAWVNGADDQVKAFIEWCRSGPPRARVDDVIINEEEDLDFASFSIRK